MLKKWLVLVLITISVPLIAKTNVDSLYRVARKNGDLQQAKKVYDLASELGNKKVAANGQYLIGWLHREKNEYSKAVSHYFEASLLYAALHEEVLLADVYENIGEIFINTLHHNNALLFFKKALALRQNQDDLVKYGQTLMSIGLAKRRLGEYDSAMHYYTLAKEKLLMAGAPKLLKNVYNGMGFIMEITESHKLAGEYYRLVFDQAQSDGDGYWESKALHNMGAVAVKMGNIDGGLSFYNETLTFLQKNKNEELLMSTLNNIGQVYQGSGELTTARGYFQKAVEYTEHGNNELKMDSYMQLSRLDEKLGNMKAALEHSRKYENLANVLLVAKNDVDQALLFYEGELAIQHIQQRQLAKIEAEKHMFRTVIWSLTVLLSVALLLFFYKRGRESKKIARERKQTLDLITESLNSVLKQVPAP
jgi:tetratricopeptide (TPR) repeat protein